MIRTLFDNHVFIYILLVLTGLGMLMKLVVQILYSRLLRASESMGTSKCKLAQTMKKKFEAYYKLKLGVNNVDIFVDKHFFHYKFCGIFLSTWETLCGQVLVLTLLTGAISTILGLIYECGKNQILSTFSVGILCCGLLIFLEGIINPSGKKEMIRLNMKDYLENSLKARLIQEEIQPELMEQYKKVYQPETYLATATEQKTFVVKKKKKSKSKEAKRLEKMGQKARKKQEAENKRVNKKLQKVNKKTDKLEKQKALKVNKKNMKLEKKQSADKRREEKIAARNHIKTQALEDKERMLKEKQHQEEIKKALSLEKKAMKEPKNLTLAQAKKETLLREVHGRRNTDIVPENEQDEKILLTEAKETGASTREDISPNVMEEASKDKEVKEDKAVSARVKETEKPYKTTAETKAFNEVSNENNQTVEKVYTTKADSKAVDIRQESIVKDAKLTQLPTKGVKAAEVKEAQPRKAEVNILQPELADLKKEKSYDDKTAAALEDGSRYRQKGGAVVRPTSEEEEKIIADILKDLFS